MINLKTIKPDIRYLEDMKSVIYDKKWLKTAPNRELYYMYRDVAENEKDFMKIIQNNLRYDITVLKPQKLGKEFNKTLGHDHPIVPGTDITYPELYEILEGKAIFVLQDSNENNINNIFAIKAKRGDKIIIPPNYEHLFMNYGKNDLKVANWISRSFSTHIYKPFKLKHGFSYYALRKFLKIKWIKNQNYSSVPKLEFKNPNNFYKFYIPKDLPIYNLLEQPGKLDFLKNPQKYNWSLD
ncbi:MAG TPA: glucose-6-phosphate isomerase family protein [Candidatus Portnoybacteria bacterium]|nr:glucose-6-phosphate isomerase family protein [Candidatus Portnoybacteria bacterium]